MFKKIFSLLLSVAAIVSLSFSSFAISSTTDETNVFSPIFYFIIILILACVLYGVITSIYETRRERKEIMSKANIQKDKKKKRKKK